MIARRIGDGDRVGIGVNSPIPAAAALLARRLHAPHARLRLTGSPEGERFLGSKEFFDMAQRGKIDLFFFSGIQVDRMGRINLHVLGDHERPRRRFAGAFGSAVLYQVIPRVILFRTEHSPRALVEQVDFVSAVGRPELLVTPRAVLAPGADGELELVSYSPWESIQSVRAATGWDLRIRPDVRATEPPTEHELEVLRALPVAG
ncbi:MAG TPA: CoA synthetase [Candidatus Dormibacteraeota bacterium]